MAPRPGSAPAAHRGGRGGLDVSSQVSLSAVQTPATGAREESPPSRRSTALAVLRGRTDRGSGPRRTSAGVSSRGTAPASSRCSSVLGMLRRGRLEPLDGFDGERRVVSCRGLRSERHGGPILVKLGRRGAASPPDHGRGESEARGERVPGGEAAQRMGQAARETTRQLCAAKLLSSVTAERDLCRHLLEGAAPSFLDAR